MKTMTRPTPPTTTTPRPRPDCSVSTASVDVHSIVETATLPQDLRAADRSELIEDLSRVLADTYAVYLKTQGYHWNVQGPRFKELHDLFQEQYEALAEAIDVIAERIRALGGFPPAGLTRLAALTEVPEEKAAPEASMMVARLERDHTTVLEGLRLILKQAEEVGDPATADLLVERMRFHEKVVWMLRASGVA